MKFIAENGITLFNGAPLLTNLKLKFKSNLMLMDTDILELDPVDVKENAVTFLEKDGNGKAVLSLITEGSCFALKVTGEYTPQSSAHGSHLSVFGSVIVEFDVFGAKRYMDAHKPYLFWQTVSFGDKLTEIKEHTQMLLIDRGNESLYFMATCHKTHKTEMFPAEKGMCVIARANTVLDEIDDCVLLGGTNENAYLLPETVTEFGLKVLEKKGKLRKDKKYPEFFEYLGWCSWDAFHMDVTDQNLLDKCQEFKDKNIPVRWMIIDDMWGHVKNIDRKTQHQREMYDWEADPVRFPKGLKGAVSDIKANYDMLVGIWHPTNGYWAGIDPTGPIAKKYAHLLEKTYTVRHYNEGPQLMHSFEKEKAEKYFDELHKFFKDCGIDFTKVDNQGTNEEFARFKDNINVTSSNLHNAIEKAANKYYDGNLINCMGMPIENFWNRESTVNRFSGDFMPEDRIWFVHHLLQCSFNSLTQGTVYVGDWDMWWSDDAQASKNAVLRAMSGGPIYMSDELNRSIREVIMPTCLSDGRILRLNTPAVPTRDCMFEDSEHNGKIYKVFNKLENGGVIAAFNLDEKEEEVKGIISPKDIENIADGEYALYDWFNGTVTVLAKNDEMELSLKNYDDFRLYVIVKIENGKAVIGLKEKYMSPLAVKKESDGYVALDDGTLLVYTADGLTEIAVKKDQKVEI